MKPGAIERKKASIARAKERVERLSADAHDLASAVTFWPEEVLAHPMLPLLVLENPENASIVRRARVEALWYRRSMEGITQPVRDRGLPLAGIFEEDPYEDLWSDVNRMGHPFDYEEDGEDDHWFDLVELDRLYPDEGEFELDIDGHDMQEALAGGLPAEVAAKIRLSVYGEDVRGNWFRENEDLPRTWLNDL